MMTDRERVDVQMVRQRIVRAQLEKIERELQHGPVELEIASPTQEARDTLTQYGYHYVGQGLFRYGAEEPAEVEKKAVKPSAGGAISDWWRGFVWGLFVAFLVIAVKWPIVAAAIVFSLIIL